jgi:hypothetical protein
MKKWLLLAVCSILVVSFFGGVNASGKFDNIITAADVEKTIGISGLKQVPRQKAVDGVTANKLLTGDINFVRSDDQPVIAVQFRPSFAFDQFKGDTGFIKSPVAGLGEEAYTGPSFDPQTNVNFVKGGYYVSVSTNVDPKDKNKAMLKIDQLIAVAKVIATRM